jgi:hypothetical protein
VSATLQCARAHVTRADQPRNCTRWPKNGGVLGQVSEPGADGAGARRGLREGRRDVSSRRPGEKRPKPRGGACTEAVACGATVTANGRTRRGGQRGVTGRRGQRRDARSGSRPRAGAAGSEGSALLLGTRRTSWAPPASRAPTVHGQACGQGRPLPIHGAAQRRRGRRSLAGAGRAGRESKARSGPQVDGLKGGRARGRGALSDRALHCVGAACGRKCGAAKPWRARGMGGNVSARSTPPREGRVPGVLQHPSGGRAEKGRGCSSTPQADGQARGSGARASMAEWRVLGV